MGVDFGDLDGDGVTDIFVSNIADELRAGRESFRLPRHRRYRRACARASRRIVDRSEALGLVAQRLGVGREARRFRQRRRRSRWCRRPASSAGRSTAGPSCTSSRWATTTLLSNPSVLAPLSARRRPSGHERLSFFVRGPGGRYDDLSTDVGLDRARSAAGSPSPTSTATAGSTSPSRTSGSLRSSITNCQHGARLVPSDWPCSVDPAAASGTTAARSATRGAAIPAIGAEVTVRTAGRQPQVGAGRRRQWALGRRSPRCTSVWEPSRAIVR